MIARWGKWAWREIVSVAIPALPIVLETTRGRRRRSTQARKEAGALVFTPNEP